MMGPGHALSGATVWLVAAPAISTLAPTPFTPEQTLLGAGVCAGAALLPDIDEPNSTVSRSFGPLTWLLSNLVNALSAGFMNLTGTRRDSHVTDGHRGLTHTLLGAVVFSMFIGALVGTVGKWSAIGLLFFLLGLAIRGLMGDWAKKNGWIGVTVVAAGLAFVAGQFLPADGHYWWLSVTVFTGIIVHVLGDGITKEGIPYLAPLPFRGKAWWEFNLPSFLAIRAGGWTETTIIYPTLTITLITGLTAQLLGGWHTLFHHLGIG